MIFFLVDVPTPPQNVCAKEVNKNHVVLIWDVPEKDGGSPITGYFIERKDVKKSSWISAGETKANILECKVEKLTEGNNYVFNVFAENDIGRSEPGSTEPIKARLPFGK